MDRLFSFMSFNNFNYTKYKNILQFIPYSSKAINEYKYDVNNELLKSIKEFCVKNQETKFIVSLSGGVDSMVLISIIHYLGYNVIGLHINYNNRDETYEEQEFLKDWCYYNNIKLYTKVIENIKRSNSKRCDYESITKKIRFDFYKTIMQKENANIILLGHHKDDIVENIFANVCRGRYILDLAVIKKYSTIENVNIGRPMIEFYKKSVYEFADIYQVPYFKDTTPNWSVRGKYRNAIYPVIEDTFTPNIKENLIGLSKQSYEWNSLIQQKIIQPFMDDVVYFHDGVLFNIEKYNNYPLSFWNLVFMNIFINFGCSCPSRKGIQTFMNSINKFSTHNYNISLSNTCKTCVKSNCVTIMFIK